MSRLLGLLGPCEVCGSPAAYVVCDRQELEPKTNYMGILCRRFGFVHPDHRWCELHKREPVIYPRKAGDDDEEG